jgi:peptide/nickel transport system ATP-binding protein
MVARVKNLLVSSTVSEPEEKSPTVLDVRNLSVDYLVDGSSALHAVDDVSFSLEEGRSLGLVGESGCGKTTTMLAMLRLLPAEGRIVSGQVLNGGTDVLSLPESDMRQVRWNKIAIIFQGAMNALNPVRRVGDQISEAIVRHGLMDQRMARRRVGDLLELVGITPEMAKRYPHEYSGGMRQRAMTAMALACSPDILIADEPTTALDVMIQAQILDLFQRLQKELGLSLIVVTHDLGVVAEVCDDVLVMYGGKTVEYGSVDKIFNEPLHPYTQRLMEALPDIDHPTAELASIPGHPPPLDALPAGCRFEPRCQRRQDKCAVQNPPLLSIDSRHRVACFYTET